MARQAHITELHKAPAHLWSGPKEIIANTAQRYVQKLFCTHDGCSGSCTTCVLIAQNNFYGLSWLVPERQYAIDQVRNICQKATLCLAPGERHLFVLEDAHALNAASANSLLKIVEEPPQGYHFLFLSPYPEQIVPTIRSRCIVTELSGTSEIHETKLLQSLCPPQLCSPAAFSTIIQAELPRERDCPALIEQLLIRWATHYRSADIATNKKLVLPASHIQQTLIHALSFPPPSGSSKLFWKNLYIQLHIALQRQK